MCKKCKNKYDIINRVPFLLSRLSIKELDKQLSSNSGKKMSSEYANKKSFLKVPDLTFNIIDRKRLHRVFTFNESDRYVVLNIGGGPKREENNVINLNIDSYLNVDIVGDAHNLPFRSNSFDSVMIAAVLEHVKNPKKVVDEAYRVLKKGGYIYAETPFLQHFHGYPNHYQNYTIIGHDYLMNKFKKIESGSITGPVSTICLLTLNLFEDFIDNKYIRKILMMGVATFLFPLKFIDVFFKKNQNVYKLTSGVYFLGMK